MRALGTSSARPLSTLRLLALRDHRAARIPPWSAIIRGSLMRYLLTCGNKACRCHKARQYRHGPYWYVSTPRGAGRNRLVLIAAAQAPAARGGIAAYKKLWKSLCRISDFNLALLKAGAWRPDEPRRARK